MIMNLIKYCLTGLKAKDAGKYTTQQTNNENKRDSFVMYPYGMHANAPAKSWGVTFNIQGKEENSAAIITSTFLRTKNLKEGEVEFGNQNVGSLTFYDASGNITATAQASYTINATDLSINCDTTIDGALDTTGDITTTTNISCVNLTASGTITCSTLIGAVQAATLSVSGSSGVSGTFITADSPAKTVTVTGGIITSIV